MRRTIIAYEHYFDDFIKTLQKQVVEKLYYVFSILENEEKVSKKFVKYIRDGLYEVRIKYESNNYRVFFIFDEGQIVVLFSGFKKKTQETPKQEIEKALRIKEAYYADKQNHKL